MRTITVQRAVVIEDCFFPSGLPMLKVGEAVEVWMDGQDEGRAVRVKGVDRLPGQCLAITNDEDWVWKHLVLEGPWAMQDDQARKVVFKSKLED